MNCHIENANFILKSRPFILKDIRLIGEITNGEDRNFQKTKIEITQFDAKTETGFIKGDFTIQNLNQYYLTANLSSSWNLSEINHYFEDSPFFNLKNILHQMISEPTIEMWTTIKNSNILFQLEF